MAMYSPRYLLQKSANLVSEVSLTSRALSLMNPHFLLLKVMVWHRYNYTYAKFFLDFPFVRRYGLAKVVVNLRGVTDTAEIAMFSIVVVSVMSLTPRKWIVNKISRRIRSSMGNGFNPLVRDLGGFD
jgi:hypothetical protein